MEPYRKLVFIAAVIVIKHCYYYYRYQHGRYWYARQMENIDKIIKKPKA